LSTVQFLSINYFAVGLRDASIRVAEKLPTEYIIYKVRNGKPICRFKLKQDSEEDNEFKFLKNNTAPNNWSYHYTGILDKRTNVIYNINLMTLLHLGATSFVLNPDDYNSFFRS
jgi:hypothetical protein